MGSPIALLLIRAWRDDGSKTPFRAEIRLTQDVAMGFLPALAMAGTEGIMGAVRIFLSDPLAAPVP